jgi:hypothetical protein
MRRGSPSFFMSEDGGFLPERGRQGRRLSRGRLLLRSPVKVGILHEPKKCGGIEGGGIGGRLLGSRRGVEILLRRQISHPIRHRGLRHTNDGLRRRERRARDPEFPAAAGALTFPADCTIRGLEAFPTNRAGKADH